jgi:hypothetical protein
VNCYHTADHCFAVFANDTDITDHTRQ